MPSPAPFSTDEMIDRLGRVRARMAGLGFKALVSRNPSNVRYLTGFRGEPRAVLVTADRFLLVTADRTLPWARRQTAVLSESLELRTSAEPAAEICRHLPRSADRVCLDLGTTHASIMAWRGRLASDQVEPAAVIEHVRQIKSTAEIALLQESQDLNEEILATVLPQIRPDMTERGVQGLLLSEMARNEAVDAFSFPPIVAAGGNCWEIHHLPDDTVIGTNQLILVDLGVMHRGYASDMTRAICLGKATSRMHDIHSLVLEALETAMEAALPGTTNLEVDRAARELIQRAGHGPTFTHGLGHQIGLDIHDPAPALSPRATETAIEAGMAFTIEPGVYLEGLFGIRIEDVVIVTQDGPHNLTRFPRHLLELPA